MLNASTENEDGVCQFSPTRGHLEYRMQRMHRMQRIWCYRDGGVRGTPHRRRRPPRYFSNH